MEFNSAAIEEKWKRKWEEDKIYKVELDESKPKFYVLDMFPYPSGAGLHVGHPLGYVASDIYSRYKRMNGFNVLHPMGFDAFGLPAEEYAITSGIHPAQSTADNIAKYRVQLDNLGFSFDWDREVRTCDPKYYKWTQWIFKKIFESYYDKGADKAMPIESLIAEFEKNGNQQVNADHSHPTGFTAEEWKAMDEKVKSEVLMNYRLAYQKIGYVNWCEGLGTVLANDQVKDGVSDRGGHPVIKKEMKGWALRVTAYANRLLNDLKDLEWSDSLKAMQSNWIGQSEGAQLFFPVENSDVKIEVFTTRIDTIYGATFMVLAPENELVQQLTQPGNVDEINEYKKYVESRSEIDRMSEAKEVTGAFTGSYAINPINNKKIPIWIAEYVLNDYGTGAIMAVPSDDERDNAFAKKFGLEIIPVVDRSKYPDAKDFDKVGVMINSDLINGMEVKEAIAYMLGKIEKDNIGTRQINYKLRDMNFSRQRYWGEPFPIYFDDAGIAHAVPDNELPVELPMIDDFKPGHGGKSPLSKNEEWVNEVPGKRREVDTMPATAGSSWYALRYMDPTNDGEFVSKKAVNYWQDVDLYIGGTEHAVSHLLYSRFWHKVLFDYGLVPTKEPFKKLINQGMIQGVIEYIYLLKEKKNGHHHFMCSSLAQKKGITAFSKLPVHADFMTDYGSSESHLTMQGIREFIDWRPGYKDAIFECGMGTYHQGAFTPVQAGVTDSKLITDSEVGKMSKRYFNVVNPDDVVAEHGADTFRMYEMFLGPIEQSKPWDIKGIDGVWRFVRRFWSMFYDDNGNWMVTDEAPTKEEMKVLHATIKKVCDDVERFSFNTCISGFMVAVNELKKLKSSKKAILEPLVRLLAPFAPFMTEELYEKLGNNTSVHLSGFPKFEEKYVAENEITYPICINGKKRAISKFAVDMSNADMEKVALAMEEIQKWTEGKTVRKVIVVPKKMINIVVG